MHTQPLPSTSRPTGRALRTAIEAEARLLILENGIHAHAVARHRAIKHRRPGEAREATYWSAVARRVAVLA